MKNLCYFFVFFTVSLYGQNISGVVQTENNRPIANANIYIDGSRSATTSAIDGSFNLDVKGQENGTLIIQKVGFENAIVSVHQIINKKAVVKLLSVQEIEEVILIPYTDEAYRNHIRYFLDTFIGVDQKNVVIKNVKTLKFSYDKKNKLLKVKAPKILIIENRNLGYTIRYDLANYEADFTRNTITYSGTSYFTSTSEKPDIIVNRINAYLGSLQHFVRACYSRKITEEGFRVNFIQRIENPKYPTFEELQRVDAFQEMMKTQKNYSVPQDISEILGRKRHESQYNLAVVKTGIPETDFIREENGRKFLTFPYILQIVYARYPYSQKKGKVERSALASYPSSFLYIEGNSFEIYRDGNTSYPELLLADGDFGASKMEKFLPSDYQLGD